MGVSEVDAVGVANRELGTGPTVLIDFSDRQCPSRDHFDGQVWWMWRVINGKAAPMDLQFVG